MRQGEAMQYMLLIYEDEKSWAKMSEAEKGKIFSEYGQLTEDLKKSGRHLGGNPLQPTSTATTVRVRNGKRLTTSPLEFQRPGPAQSRSDRS
jgi:hypothetical protein